MKNGGPAPESLTDALFAETTRITTIHSCPNLPVIDLDKVHTTVIHKGKASGDSTHVASTFTVEVIDAVEDYLALLQKVFSFDALKAFVGRSDFSIAYDALCGGT